MIYSIGYAGKTIQDIIRTLKSQGITTLADVRSAPGSRAFPDFNRAALTQSLAAAGITYHWLGDTLGPRSSHPDHYDATGQVQFDRLRQSAEFGSGLETLIGLGAGEGVVCLCAEKRAETCHRSLLIGEALFDRGILMQHITFEGELESHAALRARAAESLGGLFPDEREGMQQLIRQYAYRRPEAPSGPAC